MAIEKEMKLSEKEMQLNKILFGGNKGYEWLTSFLGLMHIISFTKIHTKKELKLT